MNISPWKQTASSSAGPASPLRWCILFFPCNTSLKQLILVMNYSYMLSDGPVLILLHHPEYYTNISADWTVAPIICLSPIYHGAHTCTQILLGRCSLEMGHRGMPHSSLVLELPFLHGTELQGRLGKGIISRQLTFLGLCSCFKLHDPHVNAFQSQRLWKFGLFMKSARAPQLFLKPGVSPPSSCWEHHHVNPPASSAVREPSASEGCGNGA